MRRGLGALACALVVVGVGLEARGDQGQSVTIWRTPVTGVPWGGAGYGGYTTMYGGAGAFVTDRRKVDIPASGELSFDGVAAAIDPATVQFRSVTDPSGTTVLEQRFVRGLANPDELLVRHVGKTVTVVTAKGEVAGTLRAIDADSIVLEIGAGPTRAVEVLRRGDFVRDIRLSGATLASDRPSLVWKLKTGRPGAQQIEVAYRTAGLAWTPDYTAVLDEAKRTIDFSAWATISNNTGVDFDDVDLTLVTGSLTAPAPAVANPLGGQALARPAMPTTSYTVPRRVRLGRGESVQVELMPARIAAKAARVVLFEAAADQSGNFQGYPNQDCYNYVPGPGPRSQVALELAASGGLPEGRVRLFKRTGGTRLDVVSEDTLRVNAHSGVARIGLAEANDKVTGERRSLECRADERTRSLREKIEVKVENKGKEALDIVVREFMFRWVAWRIDAEDAKGSKAAPQTQEYRLRVSPGGKKSITYTVVYSW